MRVLERLPAGGHKQHLLQGEGIGRGAGHVQMRGVRRIKRSAEDADTMRSVCCDAGHASAFAVKHGAEYAADQTAGDAAAHLARLARHVLLQLVRQVGNG